MRTMTVFGFLSASVRSIFRYNSAVYSSSTARSTVSSVLDCPYPSQFDSVGVYIHVPFCKRKCFYCDFAVSPIGMRSKTHQIVGEKYTDLVIRDIKYWSSIAFGGHDEDNWAKHIGVDTIYFGGGTPSLLPDQCLSNILTELRRTYRVSDTAEITLEMDPGTFDYDRLLRLRDYGINRISMGVQSFSDDILKSCGRAHSVDDTFQAVHALHKANWNNFNIDLISSLPNLSLDGWEDTLKQAVDLGSSHISVYDLQVEQGTPFHKWYTPGVFPLPTEEIAAQMYSKAVEVICKDGKFEHYEVSNYARPNMRSRHNLKYWQCKPVIAFGNSAASYINGDRFVRPKNLRTYESFVSALEHQAGGIDNAMQSSTATEWKVSPVHRVSSHFPDDVLDVIMLSLRTADGIHFPSFVNKFGESSGARLLKGLAPFIKNGLVTAITIDGRYVDTNQSVELENISRLRLTDPNGFLVSNDIISSVFSNFS